MPGILDKHRNKNFVKRMFDNTKSIDKGDGNSSTHIMSYTERNGKYIMFPMVVEIDGKLKEFDDDKWRDAVDYALKNNEYIEFDTEKEASDFSKFGYKVESGMISEEDANFEKFKEEPDKNKYEIFKSTNMSKEETLKKQQKVTIGDRTINITDGYGVRGKDFKDREGQHSKGIDITTDNDRVISLTDGVVEVASLDGSPTLVGTDKEQSGGYYLIIKNDDGTRSQYMHLDAMTPEEQKNIIGKRVKRGDDLGGYGVGSGSGTDPHIKYRVFTGDVGTQLETHIDPSSYISSNNKTLEPELDVRSSADDKKWIAYLKTTDKEGEQRDRLLGTYNKSNVNSIDGVPSINLVTVGNSKYAVASKTNEDGDIDNTYEKIAINNDGSVQKSKQKDKAKVFIDEINNVISEEGVTRESAEKAKKIFEQSEIEFDESDLDYSVVGEVYENKARIPLIQKNIEESKVFTQNKLQSLQKEILTATPEERKQIKSDIQKSKSDLASIKSSQEDFNKEVESIRANVTKYKYGGVLKDPNGNVISGGKKGLYLDYKSKSQVERYEDFKSLEKNYNQISKTEPFQGYVKDLIKKQSEEKKAVGKTGSTTTTLLDTNAVSIDEGVAENPNNLTDDTEEVDLGKGDYLDKQALEETLAEINKQLSDTQKVEEFTPDLSMLDKQNSDRYGNLISMASDLGVGMMGLKGAMEEVPTYEKGAMFQAYTDEAYRQRNMGLSNEEMGLRKQLAERGFGYDVKNIRRLSGGSAGVALGNLGRATGTLQNRYAQIAAEDSATKRINQQRFDRAAGADETLNRRKFEDSFNVAMKNKEMGAQLVRDKMKNMNERQMFEKQYGKGSIYDELSREMLVGKQYNNHALKMAKQYQTEQAEAQLNKEKIRIESDLRKANNQ